MWEANCPSGGAPNKNVLSKRLASSTWCIFKVIASRQYRVDTKERRQQSYFTGYFKLLINSEIQFLLANHSLLLDILKIKTRF